MKFINCEINLDLNWSENCVIVATSVAAQAMSDGQLHRAKSK